MRPEDEWTRLWIAMAASLVLLATVSVLVDRATSGAPRVEPPVAHPSRAACAPAEEPGTWLCPRPDLAREYEP